MSFMVETYSISNFVDPPYLRATLLHLQTANYFTIIVKNLEIAWNFAMLEQYIPGLKKKTSFNHNLS